jgi:hypothetical protein
MYLTPFASCLHAKPVPEGFKVWLHTPLGDECRANVKGTWNTIYLIVTCSGFMEITGSMVVGAGGGGGQYN